MHLLRLNWELASICQQVFQLCTKPRKCLFLRLWSGCVLKVMCWNPNAQNDSISRWGFDGCSGQEGGGLRKGMRVLIKKTAQITPLTMCLLLFSHKSRPTCCDPGDCGTPGFPVLYHLPEFKSMSIKSVMLSKHLISYYPLLLLPSIFPNIRLLSNETALYVRRPK